MSTDPRAIVGVMLLVGTLACASNRTASQPRAVPAPATATMVADRLVFGRSILGGTMVTDSAWQDFLHEYVTPRFPDGLTVLRAEGQWRDPLGTVIREATVMLEVFHPESPFADLALGEIAEEYKRRFNQETVLRTTSRVGGKTYE
jgi:hypothetical protein